MLRSRIVGGMIERYGTDWEVNEATIAAARATLETELDRYLFDAEAVPLLRWMLDEVREAAQVRR